MGNGDNILFKSMSIQAIKWSTNFCMSSSFISQVCTCVCGLGGVIQKVNGAAFKEGAPRTESHRHTMQQTVPQPV